MNWGKQCCVIMCWSVMVTMTHLETAWASDLTSDEWQFTVAPYVWAVGMDGEVVKDRRLKTDSEASPIKVLIVAVFAMKGNGIPL